MVFCLVILGRVAYIQHFEGNFWITQAKQQQQKFIDIEPPRGTIYSEDGSMLSTSIPFFDVYVDFAAEGLREKNGKRFHENIDSLSICLAALFKNMSSGDYKKQLLHGYRKKERYFLLKKDVSFQQYKILRDLPLIRLGKNKSGFIAEEKSKRLNPFGLLANRTIGLSREYIASDGKIKNTNVGLEKTYDVLLKGESGKRLVRYLAGGVYAPVEGYEIEPENGKDIITTIDVNIQDITENALLHAMEENECRQGTCIVMEVATGKIKAIANLGLKPDGSYWEDLNYAIRSSEPGSTFKLATMLALLEDNKITLSDRVNLEGGSWKVSGRTVYDSEKHNKQDVNVKEAFEYSSNVGMAKLVWANYSSNPDQYIDHLRRLRFDKTSGIDLVGETKPVVKTPKSKTWSGTSLPWMSFGYEVLVSPLQTLMLYNAVANNGIMMKPYLVNSVRESGLVISENNPTAVEEKICSEKTLARVKECLVGVCSDSGGTAYNLFKGCLYKVAGKTGTALVANDNRGYADHIYQSSFAGYFPAEDPKYSCIVVIRNKPYAKKFYGAAIAGPVFREIADKLYAMNIKSRDLLAEEKKDSSFFFFSGSSSDMRLVMNFLLWKYKDSSQQGQWANIYPAEHEIVMKKKNLSNEKMPDMTGMGLKDALYLLEKMKVRVIVKGKGKVTEQSIKPDSAILGGETIIIELN